MKWVDWSITELDAGYKDSNWDNRLIQQSTISDHSGIENFDVEVI